MLKQRLHATRIGVTILALISFGTGALANETHTIGKGDTLWSLSRQYKVSVNDIKRENNVSSNKPLKIGLKLSIPTGKKSEGVGSERSKQVRDKALTNKLIKRFGVRAARQLAQQATEQIRTNEQGKPELVRTALTYRGSRYVRGGTGRRGFDCSGFTRYVYAKHGVSLPHSSCAQAQCGRSVDRSELKPGDLVFFQTRSRGISHVGIYVGSSRFVHAATPRYGVVVSSLDDAYYRSRYKCARRVKHKA